MTEHPGLRDSVQDDADTDEETVAHWVCFSITGEGTTRTVRDMWQSQLPYNAIEVLKCMIGLPEDEYMPIILGTRQLNGDSRNGNLGIEDDDAAATGEYDPMFLSMEHMLRSLQGEVAKLNLELFLRFGVMYQGTVASKAIRNFKSTFASFDERMRHLQKQVRAAADFVGIPVEDIPIFDGELIIDDMNPPDYIEEAKKRISEVWKRDDLKPEDQAPIVSAIAYDGIARQNLSLIREMDLDEDDYIDWEDEGASSAGLARAEEGLARFGSNMSSQINKLEQMSGIKVPDLDTYLQQQHEYEPEDIKACDIRTAPFNSGYIDPAGRFYGCPDIQHMTFAEDLRDAGKFTTTSDDCQVVLDALGWVKFSMGRFYCEKPLTQPQKDVLFDFAVSRSAVTLRFNDQNLTVQKIIEEH